MGHGYLTPYFVNIKMKDSDELSLLFRFSHAVYVCVIQILSFTIPFLVTIFLLHFLKY